MSKPTPTLPTDAGENARDYRARVDECIVPSSSRSVRRPHALTARATRSTSANTPAAVTSGPAPGPCTIERVVAVAAGGELDDVVGQAQVGEGMVAAAIRPGRRWHGPRRRAWPRSAAPARLRAHARAVSANGASTSPRRAMKSSTLASRREAGTRLSTATSSRFKVTSRFARKDHQFAGDIGAGKIVARIGFGVAQSARFARPVARTARCRRSG